MVVWATAMESGMKRTIWGAVSGAVLAVALSNVPVWGRPLPKTEPTLPVRACPEMGEGFVRLPGSDTCIKLGGSVRLEFMRQSGSATLSDY